MGSLRQNWSQETFIDGIWNIVEISRLPSDMHVSRILGMILTNNISWELISKWMIVREFIISIIVIVMKIFQFLKIF